MILLQKGERLLFQGDSITHGGRIDSDWDQNHLLGHGYQSILASRIGLDSVHEQPVILNRGVSGDSISMMYARRETDIFALEPTILSILIGVNDCHNGEETAEEVAARFERVYRALLTETVERLPAVRLVLGAPFAFLSPKAATDPAIEKGDRLRMEKCRRLSVCTRAIAADFGAVFVPFDDHLAPYVAAAPSGHVVWDGIHPTYVGHEVMARTWYETVKNSTIGV